MFQGMKTIRVLALGITLAVSILPVGNTAIAEFTNEGVIHTVFLWLKKPGDGQHRRQLLIASDRLRSIEGVLDIRFGEKIESNRDIVDDSFDVGIYFYFSDVAAMDRYLAHPLHRATVEQDIKPLVERIVVHDFQHTVIR
jgi:hypothetical protein